MSEGYVQLTGLVQMSWGMGWKVQQGAVVLGVMKAVSRASVPSAIAVGLLLVASTRIGQFSTSSLWSLAMRKA